MARNPRPAIQGELDGLCGVYSVVNAIQWALHTCNTAARARGRGLRPLSDLERLAFFDMLVTALSTRGPLAKFVTVGVRPSELAWLLRISRQWVSDHRNAELVSRRPCHRQRASAKPRIVNLLTEHLAVPGSAVIVGVDAPLDHWTVVTGLSSKRIHLLDSGFRKYLTFSGITYRSASRLNGVRLGSIFLLRLSPEAGERAKRP